ncbi:hypothetical protein BCR32DRAFT_282273 [Anaeromyces robustus]|uniref:Uncharacterized protein n=1 Tax=Anaeromyces robustus TaxID=1754192 RepID=A0A1Y1WYH2_9FUNG|nr:hypothetical protein BCR32DRAFT_282273 [Anaeromyces robustus]|eukprot:ORX78435.1 hypothetical protein BCR32DRAFT_282273 [Anaeromyces robustus]
MEDLSPYLSNTFMNSLYKKIENEYPKEKINIIVKKMINFYKLKQKDTVMDGFLKMKDSFPFSCFKENEIKKCEINEKPYQDLLLIIRNIDTNNPICDNSEIIKIKSIDGFISLLENFKSLDAFKQSHTLKNIYSIPKKPVLGISNDEPSMVKLRRIQQYISELGYNNLGIPFFEINKSSSYNSLMRMAKLMINTGLPIKFERFSLSFKSEAHVKIYRHIVLAIKIRGKYGAIGLSRKDDLHWKEPVYKTLKDLILDYKKAYRRHNHTLMEVKIGYKIPHEVFFSEKIVWKHAVIKCTDKYWLNTIDEVSKTL